MHRELIEYAMDLSTEDVQALIAMGPSAHHAIGVRRAGRVTASVMLETYLDPT